jgi:hypothetical protein
VNKQVESRSNVPTLGLLTTSTSPLCIQRLYWNSSDSLGIQTPEAAAALPDILKATQWGPSTNSVRVASNEHGQHSVETDGICLHDHT